MLHRRFACWVLALLAALSVPASATRADEPWLAHYGDGISWEREKAEMDNFAIQIQNEPNFIGYILVYSGTDSCRGEAQARALRIKKYLMNVRGVPWNRVMWKDGGRYKWDGLDIFLLGFYRNVTGPPDVPYEPPPTGHAIPECRTKRDRR